MPQHGKTPLHWAAEEGHVAVVGALLNNGADKEAKDKVSGGRVQVESGVARCSSLWFRLVSLGTEWNDLSQVCFLGLNVASFFCN